MNKVPSLNLKNLFAATALLGIFLMIGGCTEVIVRVSTGGNSGASSPEDPGDLPPHPPCNLPEASLAIVGYKIKPNTAWCWAASAQMVINYFRTAEGEDPLLQCDIVDVTYNHPPNTCCGASSTSPLCNKEGNPLNTFNRMQVGYENFKNPSDRENLWGWITSQICENKPLILAEVFSSGLGHSSVIYGDGENDIYGRYVDIYDHLDEPVTDPLSGQLEVEQVSYDDEIYFVPGNDLYGRTAVYYTFNIQLPE